MQEQAPSDGTAAAGSSGSTAATDRSNDTTVVLGFGELVETLRAIAEPTRLRLVALLARAQLTVTEITEVIGQSQPRTSRHLRLLVDAGVLERAPEGAYVYYLVADGAQGAIARQLARTLPDADPTVVADRVALERVMRARAAAAEAFRNAHAKELGALKGLYVGEPEVERAMLELLVRDGPIGRLLDIGTGTGRVLELLAPHSERSVGLDLDRDMLRLARAALGEARFTHASVRHGDLHRPPFTAASFDVAIMHHVLSLLDDPGAAVTDAARLLRPGGRLLIVDFAEHDLEDLRLRHGHRNLGVGERQLRDWARAADMRIESERSLPPAGRGQRLTVRLWLLRAPSKPTRSR